MKKQWILVSGEGWTREVECEWDDICERNRELTLSSVSDAESRARTLAKENPGKRYQVFELVSAFVVDGLTEERAK